MKGLKHINLVDLVVILSLGSTLLYAVANNIPALGSFRWFWGPLSIFLIFISQPQILFKRIVLFSMVYGLLFLVVFPATIWSEMSDWNRNTQLQEFYGLFFSVFLISHFISSSKVYVKKITTKFVFIFITLTLVMTHFALFIDSNIVRDSANSFDGNPIRMNLFKKTGAMGYGYAQAIVILLPVLIYYIKKKSYDFFRKSHLILILVLSVLLIIRANVFANLIVASIVSFLALVSSKNRIISIVFITILVVILLLIPLDSYINALNFSKEFFETDSFIYQKLHDISQFLTGSNPEDKITGAGNRASRYPMLLEALMEAPFFGAASNEFTSYRAEGGHLYFMNRLAQWGVPFFLIFIFLLYNIYKRISNLFSPEFKYYYILSTIAFIFLGLMKNIAGREPFLMLFFIIPVAYISINYKRDKRVRKNKEVIKLK